MENKYLNDSEYDKKIATALAAEILLPAIKFCLLRPIPGFFQFNKYANIVLAVIMMILIIPTIKIIYNRSGRIAIASLLLLSIFILLNIILFPENIDNIKNQVFDIYSISYICFVLSISLKDYDVFLKYLYKISPAVIIAGLFNVFAMSLVEGNVASYEQYDMSLSYYMLVPTITMLSMFYNKKNIKGIIFFLIGTSIIIARGSRGVLIGIGSFIIIYKLKNIKITKNSIYKGSIFGSICLFILLNFKKIILSIITLLAKFDIQSRTLEYLLIGDITNSSNRDIIAMEILKKISEKPIFGIGLLGDLRSHNIILETILFYGIIIGSLLLLLLLIIIIKSLLYKENKILSILIIIFFSYAIPDSLLNLTIWGKDMFWIYMGLSMNAFLRNREGI